MRLINADSLKEWFFRAYSNEESYSNTDIAEIIDTQPTIHQTEEGWIFVKEQFPIRDGMYIVTKEKDGISENGVTWAMYSKARKQFYLPGGRIDFTIKVKAWMPFPKEYEGE